MIPKLFVQKYLPFAKQTYAATGIHPYVILAQAALESGWGEKAVGNMFFGVKDTDGVNGNEQLLTTTEYLRTPNAKFPAILKVVALGKGLWKYTVKDWFRKYPSPEQSFTDHAKFFLTNPRYKEALKVKGQPYLFAAAIAKAGYATAPNYSEVLQSVIRTIEKAATGL